MNLFKKKPLIEPTEEMLEKSVRSNLFSVNCYGFIAFSLGVIMATNYVYTQKVQIEFILTLIVSLIFYAMHMVITKVDKARLEILKATKEE